jgi:repressor LexA
MRTPAAEEKKQKVYEYIVRFINEHGYAPSYLEITMGCVLSSTSVASYHVQALADDGKIVCSPHIARSIVLVKHGDS